MSALPLAAGPLTLGLLRIGHLLLALPVDNLREVIACPKALSPLPLATEGVRGAVRLRGSVIPVLDLRSRFGLPACAEAEPVLVLMRHRGRLLGLQADAVHGMAQVGPAELHALGTQTAQAAGMISTHGFEVGEQVASLLDPARIAGLPGVPMVEEVPAAEATPQQTEQTAFLLFDCGGLSLGVDAMAVDATVPLTEIRVNALRSELCMGVIEHHGLEVPVVDTLSLLGLGRPASADSSAVVVLRFPEGPLGLRLDTVRDIVQVVNQAILPMKGLGGTALLLGMLDPAELPAGASSEEPAKAHLLLDLQALWADPLLRSLASMSQPVAKVSASKLGATAVVANSGQTYLTYRAGVETASPLAQLGEIIHRPALIVPLPQSEAAVLGWFSHRGAAVPLVCLCSLLGRSAQLDPVQERVLLVPDGQRQVGLLVESLSSIESSTWEQSRDGRHTEADLERLRQVQPLVEVGEGARQRTLPRLDLVQLIRALAPSTTPSVAVADAAWLPG